MDNHDIFARQSRHMRVAIIVSYPDDWTAQAFLASILQKRHRCIFPELLRVIRLHQQRSIRWLRWSRSPESGRHSCAGPGQEGDSTFSFRFEALQALQERGIAIINPPQAIARAANKFATYRALHDAGVATPRTVVTTSIEEALRARA